MSYPTYYTDERGFLLPRGTVVHLHPGSPHTGIIGYDEFGTQVVAHNSKKFGKAVVSSLEDFNDTNLPVRYTAPANDHDGQRIWDNAMSDVERGVLWSPWNNCQDFVSRAISGQNGSPTRDLLVGIAALVAAAIVLPKVFA
jgi:hypothetical protein